VSKKRREDRNRERNGIEEGSWSPCRFIGASSARAGAYSASHDRYLDIYIFGDNELTLYNFQPSKRISNLTD
jgi:hypothetical protein